MAINIDHNFVRQYGATVEDVAAQMKSQLRQAVTELKVIGKDFSVPKLADTNDELRVISSRHADTVISDMTHSNRVGFITSYTDAVMVDDEDKIRLLIDPTSDYVRHLGAQLNRTMDSRIIEAALGVAKEGETGSTSVDLPSAQVIAHGSTGLTLAKVKNALKILMANHVDVDSEELFLAVNAAAYEDLILDTGMISIDNVNNKPNQSGRVFEVAGFKVIHCQRLSSFATTTTNGGAAASTNRPALAFTKSAIRLGTTANPMYDVSRVPMKQLNHLAQVKTSFGALRVHDEKVVDIRFQE